mmetsp:Transcript_17653/g.26323  ORF Transcript_17653/g.26323 Transcript_17653/m.26323 type:complete len:285 (-) Transcript_17653:234-1088(-)
MSVGGIESFFSLKALSGWFGKTLIAILLAFTTLRYSFGIYAWRAAEKLEKPSYSVVKFLPGGVELRQYDPYLIAEVTCSAEGFREPTKEGFQACAGYIFGKNEPRRRNNNGEISSEKMAMTAPVRTSARTIAGEKMAMTAPVRSAGGIGDETNDNKNSWFGNKKKNTKVSFVIGSKYTLSTVPRPKNKNVRIRQVKGHLLAVTSFSGKPPSDERVKKERSRIDDALSQSGLNPSIENGDDETFVYGYHDPFITPNLLRKNEVAVMVCEKSAKEIMDEDWLSLTE